ncbi:MAG: acyltransferase, partial [Bacteroidota bacterium]
NWDVLWSIAIEETFYLFFPILCLFLKKDWWFVGILLVCLLIAPWARTQLFPGNELADKNHLAYLDSIALGCMAAIITTRLNLSDVLRRVSFFIGIALLIAVLYYRSALYQAGISSLGLNVSMLSLGVALILLWLHQRASKPFLPVLQHMGRYSYEIYLTHMFVVLAGAQLYRGLNLGTAWLVPFIFFLILGSYALGKVLFEYFSEPLNLALRARWNRKKRKSAVPS